MTSLAVIVAALSLASPTDVMIWFEHDSVAISERGERTLQMVADDAALERVQDGAPPTLVLEGHSDRLGSQHYNLDLSLRRALAVRERLITLGYPAATLSTVGYGESAPLVTTEDGVPEADNRRVHIRFVTGRRARHCAGPLSFPCGNGD